MTILAKAVQTVANKQAIIYTCPDGYEATVSINICNNIPTREVGVSMDYLTAQETAAWTNASNMSHFVEANTPITNTPLERTGVFLGAGQSIVVSSDNTAVSYLVMGVVTALI